MKLTSPPCCDNQQKVNQQPTDAFSQTCTTTAALKQSASTISPSITHYCSSTMKTFAFLALAFLLAICGNANAFVSRCPSVVKGDSALKMTILTYGNKKKDFKPGTPLKTALPQLGVKPVYSCRKGDCATCQVLIGGQFTRACIGKVPAEPKLKSLQENGLPVSV
ncbi:expressed unknown protein [Seminavis robusta]|uniref:2Fe-2S ferredoxin-type domain-containing protein n=1 Tax=Seminavis robusta TaxID=568900 RepID=A0A9N8DSK0_9STRA|nr:expressed unknown protein [Seminavis robusta]|eukprot:Sro251_g099180.1 n/a (165) ;mRNA; f:18581-19187